MGWIQFTNNSSADWYRFIYWFLLQWFRCLFYNEIIFHWNQGNNGKIRIQRKRLKLSPKSHKQSIILHYKDKAMLKKSIECSATGEHRVLRIRFDVDGIDRLFDGSASRKWKIDSGLMSLRCSEKNIGRRWRTDGQATAHPDRVSIFRRGPCRRREETCKNNLKPSFSPFSCLLLFFVLLS